jgi:hypothetical protein
VPLAPQAVEAQTQESPVALALLRPLVCEGRSVTRDALRTQRPLAPQMVAARGASVLRGTENPPQVWATLETVCALPPRGGERRTAAAPRALSHGRIEQRGLQTRNVWAGARAWPGLAPGCRLERQVIRKKPGEVREEVGAGGTRLAPERADAARGLALVRGPGRIENPSPGGRDGTCEEERSQVRCGHSPQVMAARRNTVSGLRRGAGDTNMAAACRHFAAQPTAALHLSGIALENCLALPSVWSLAFFALPLVVWPW